MKYRKNSFIILALFIKNKNLVAICKYFELIKQYLTILKNPKPMKDNRIILMWYQYYNKN